eukprot:COSAG05_NODE_2311_length_3243_cov_8.020992_1_plen_568_part_00
MAEDSLYEDEPDDSHQEMVGGDFAVDYSGTEDLLGSAGSGESQELGNSQESSTGLSQDIDELGLDSGESQEQEADTEKDAQPRRSPRFKEKRYKITIHNWYPPEGLHDDGSPLPEPFNSFAEIAEAFEDVKHLLDKVDTTPWQYDTLEGVERTFRKLQPWIDASWNETPSDVEGVTFKVYDKGDPVMEYTDGDSYDWYSTGSWFGSREIITMAYRKEDHIFKEKSDFRLTFATPQPSQNDQRLIQSFKALEKHIRSEAESKRKSDKLMLDCRNAITDSICGPIIKAALHQNIELELYVDEQRADEVRFISDTPCQTMIQAVMAKLKSDFKAVHNERLKKECQGTSRRPRGVKVIVPKDDNFVKWKADLIRYQKEMQRHEHEDAEAEAAAAAEKKRKADNIARKMRQLVRQRKRDGMDLFLSLPESAGKRKQRAEVRAEEAERKAAEAAEAKARLEATVQQNSKEAQERAEEAERKAAKSQRIKRLREEEAQEKEKQRRKVAKTQKAQKRQSGGGGKKKEREAAQAKRKAQAEEAEAEAAAAAAAAESGKSKKQKKQEAKMKKMGRKK